MTVRIRSLLTAGPIMVPLNSGRTVRLSPGRWSAGLRDAEVAGNAGVDKLRRRGEIEVAQDGEQPRSPTAQEEGAAKAQRSRTRTGSAG